MVVVTNLINEENMYHSLQQAALTQRFEQNLESLDEYFEICTAICVASLRTGHELGISKRSDEQMSGFDV